jgi:hypothetical protein
MASGAGGPMNLGALATVYSLVSVLYLLGLLLNVKYFCRQRSSNLPVSASRFRW